MEKKLGSEMQTTVKAYVKTTEPVENSVCSILELLNLSQTLKLHCFLVDWWQPKTTFHVFLN